MKADPSTLWFAVVSYDQRFLRVCQSYLRCTGWRPARCDVYQSGQALLDALQKGLPYRVVLLDNQTADMDCVTFCRQLRHLDPSCRPWLVSTPCQVADGPGGPPELSVLSTMLLDLQAILHTFDPDHSALRRLLDELGFEVGAQGGEYMWEACCIIADSDIHLAVRKDVLLPVSERHHVTDLAIDSGIRRAIARLEAAGRPGWLAFKARHQPKGGRFSTGRFLYAIKDDLLHPQQAEPPPLSEGDSDEREPQTI